MLLCRPGNRLHGRVRRELRLSGSADTRERAGAPGRRPWPGPGDRARRLEQWAVARRPTLVAGIEARGFVFAAPLAARLGTGFVPVRKPGKLPWDTLDEAYTLEYGEGRLEIHRDAAGPGDRVLIVDDLLATGGTAAATRRLLSRTGAEVVGVLFLVELSDLGGRAALEDRDVHALLRF